MIRVDPALRPRTFGAILDAAFESLRRDLALLASISLLINAPLAAVVLLLLFGGPLLGAPLARALLLPLAAIGAALVLLRPVAQAAIAAAVAERLEEGGEPALPRAYGRALRAALPVIFANVAFWMAAAIGGIFYVAPGLIASGALVLAPPAAALEQKGPFEALGRSYRLLRTHLGRGIGLGLMTLVIYGLLAANLFGGTAAALAALRALLGLRTAYWEAVLSLGNGLYVVAGLLAIYLAVEPYKACLVYHLHLDARVRFEAVDLLRAADRVA